MPCGELDEEERELVLAELYGSGLFDDRLPWSFEDQPATEVESTGRVDRCPRCVSDSEPTQRGNGSIGPADPCIDDRTTVPVSDQKPCGSLVPFASLAPHDERDRGEPEIVKLPRVAVRR